MRRQPDPVWGAIVGEIIHNLRCALDYMIYQLVILETGAEPTGKRNQFPIFKTESGFESRGVPQMLQGIASNKTIALIKSLQPFATGDDVQSPLWRLQEFSNWDKHRAIGLTCVSAYEIKASGIRGSELLTRLAVAQPGPFEDYARLFGRMIPPGPEPVLERAANVQVDGEALIHITFKKPAVDFDLSAPEILARIGRGVSIAVKQIEAEIFNA